MAQFPEMKKCGLLWHVWLSGLTELQHAYGPESALCVMLSTTPGSGLIDLNSSLIMQMLCLCDEDRTKGTAAILLHIQQLEINQNQDKHSDTR